MHEMKYLERGLPLKKMKPAENTAQTQAEITTNKGGSKYTESNVLNENAVINNTSFLTVKPPFYELSIFCLIFEMFSRL